MQETKCVVRVVFGMLGICGLANISSTNDDSINSANINIRHGDGLSNANDIIDMSHRGNNTNYNVSGRE